MTDKVSTHAPRAGGDAAHGRPVDQRPGAVSTHAPRAGGDAMLPQGFYVDRAFQPTPPARGAT